MNDYIESTPPRNGNRTAVDGAREDRRLHRRLLHESPQRREGAHPHRRLRAAHLRHRHRHGRARARRARLRLREEVRHPDSRRHRAAGLGRAAVVRSVRRAGCDGELRPLRRHAQRGGQGRHHEVPRGARLGRPDRQLPHPRLAACRGSATGARPSRSSTAKSTARCRCRKATCRSSCRRMPSSSRRANRP